MPKKAQPTYWELLQHPLWQKKRLEVLSRDGFECSDCGSTEKMLHVHHSYYEKGLKPWEYPSESLHSLCQDCHGKAQDWMKLLHREIGSVPLYRIETVIGFIRALVGQEDLNAPMSVESFGVAEGVASYFGTHPEFVINNLRDGVIDSETLHRLVGEWQDHNRRGQ